MEKSKNSKIKESLALTREKHSQMLCKVYEVKVDTSSLSNAQKENINQLFREAKWFYNDILNSQNIFEYSTKVKEIQVKVGENFENRKLEILSGQEKQSIHNRLLSNMKSMSTNKKRGHKDKNGKFKFKSVINSIPLKQFEATYDVDFKENKVRIQGIKGWIRVRGLKQIPNNSDLCNANFVRKASGLYLHITCFINKTKSNIDYSVLPDIGIDFGIENNLTLSNGKTYNCSIPETKFIKRYSKELNKYIQRAKNSGQTMTEIKSHKHYWKLRNKLQRAYEKLTNKKTDLANKIVSEISKNYNVIAIQDELISLWHKGLFGKEVQHSCMGLIKVGLKSNPRTYIIPSSFPSTQLCPQCGSLTKHSLDKREYNCEHCGYHHDNRDIKAAETILEAAKLYGSPEQRIPNLGDLNSSACQYESKSSEKIQEGSHALV